MNARRMAQLAYYGMVERVSKAQQNILELEALIARFGDHAIPPNSMHHTLESMSTGRMKCTRMIELYQATIDELTPIILDMEAIFDKFHDDDMEAFAQYMRGRKD